MRKTLHISLLVGAMAAHGQTVSSIRFDGIGDSSVRVLFNVSATYGALRVRYGTSSCAGGSGGTEQTNGTSPLSFTLYDMTANIAGLNPSTLYNVCPEVSSDAGATWSSGAEASFTTTARTQVLPIAPTPVSTTFPEQHGSTLTVAADCSDLQVKINAAMGGDTIVVPAGTICTGAYTTPIAREAKSFTSSDVVTSTATITIASHGFSENQEVRLSAALPDCLPGNGIYPNGLSCEIGGGWMKGKRYYAHSVDSGHVQLLDAPSGVPVIPGWIAFTADAGADTIMIVPVWQAGGYASGGGPSIPANTPVQFVSSGALPGGVSADTTYYLLTACTPLANAGCVTQLSLSSGGAAVDITDAGTGTHTIVDRGSGTMYIAPAPSQEDDWILITSDGNLPPTGTRITPSYSNEVFFFRNETLFPAAGYNTPVFRPGLLAHNWRIRGADFDTGTNTDYLTSTDPRPYCGGPSTGMDHSFISFDQILITPPGTPQRFGCNNNASNMVMNGSYISIINSYAGKMDYWHPWISGLEPTLVSGARVTATTGAFHSFGFSGNTEGLVTINLTGGTATGTVYVHALMDGTIEVQAPTGTTGDCDASEITCNFTTAASPGWPTVSIGGSNRAAGIRLFTITLTTGVATAVAAADSFTSFGPPQVGEGTQAIIAGNGPGPYLLSNDFISGTGITVHFDGSGGPFSQGGDYTVTRNTFDVPAYANPNDPGADGLRYGNRQPIEWKSGQRIKIDGNIFQGCFVEISQVSVCTAFTPRSGGYITDVDVTNNTYVDSTGGSNIASPIDSYAPVSRPAARQRFSNNLFLLNGWTHYVKGVASSRGWAFFGGYATEDITIDHNTVYDNRGANPTFLHWQLHPAGGVRITNNIYFYTGNAPMFQNENIANCGNLGDKAMLDCAFTDGPGNPAYTFTGNVIVPSWADTSVPSGFAGLSTVQSAFSGPGNYVPTGMDLTANLDLVKFAAPAPRPRLSALSPYVSKATDGIQAGVSLDQSQQAQGIITQVRALMVGATTATVSAFVPNAGALCYVGYGASMDPAGWIWSSPDTSPSRQRNISIFGLTPGTQYFYTLGCSRSSLPPTAAFRTQ